jgi:O-antigen ligase
MSVLAAPLSLLALLVWGRVGWQRRFEEAYLGLLPFLPFALAYGLVSVWHGQWLGFSSVGLRLFYGALLLACARMVGLNRRQVLWAAALGCLAYAGAAFLDWGAASFARWPFHPSALRYYDESGSFRAGGGGGNPIHYADVAMWLLGLCALTAYFASDLSRLRRWGWAACSVAGFAACLSSQSRGALVALAALYLVLAFYATRQQHRILMGVGMAALLLAFALAVQQQWVGDRLLMVGYEVHQYLTQPSFTFTSVGARLEMWRLALQALQTHQVFGLGVGSVAEVVARFLPAQPLPAQLLAQPHFHNDLMQSLVLGGALLGLGFVVTLLMLLWQARKDPMLMWVVLAGVSFGLSDLIFHQNTMMTMMVSVWCLLWATRTEVGNDR